MSALLQREDSDRSRLAGVDVLRGLCVLLVVLNHIDLRFALSGFAVASPLPRPLHQVLFESGYYAVITFFVISGFLIAGLSMRRWGALGHIHAGSFYGMRAARILPCLLLILLVLMVLHRLGVPAFLMKSDRVTLGQAVAAALTFHVNWLGYLPGGWDVLWSLSVEEAFYLAFPLVCLAFRSERWLCCALLVLIVVGPINRTVLADDDPLGSRAYLSCMDGISFGCLAAWANARVRLPQRLLRYGLGAGALLAGLIILLFNEDDHHSGLARYGLNVSLLEAAIAMIVVGLARGVGRQWVAKGTGWLRLVGRGSYEIYLFHMIVVLGLIGLFKRVNPHAKLISLWYVAMLVLSVLLGYAVSRWYSEPLNRWLRSRRLRTAPTPTPAQALLDPQVLKP